MKVQGYLLILICFISACDFLGNSSQKTAPESTPEAQMIEDEGKELRKDLNAKETNQDSSKSPIELIKEEFEAINSLELYMDTIPYMDQSTEGGEIIASYDDLGELKKVQVGLFYEMGKETEEYYLKDNQPFFLKTEQHKYNAPIYHTEDRDMGEGVKFEVFDPEKSSINWTHFYFDKDQDLIAEENPQDSLKREDQLSIEKGDRILQSFSEILAQIQSASKKDSTVSEVEDDLNPELHKWMESIAEEQNFTYMYQAFDLNGDGKDEYLCGLRGQFWCGTGGCSFVVVEEKKGGLSLLTRGGPTFSPHFISQETNKGYRSIVLDPTQGQTAEGEEYLNYPVLIYEDSSYEQVWIDNLDNTERIDKLLEGATEVLSDERTFHKVLIN